MRIGFIGLGAMGRPIAANLQRAGHELQVYDLRRIDGLGTWKDSVTEAAQDCELLFTSLPGPAEVEAVAAQVRSAQAWFDLSTNSPQVVRRIHASLVKRNVQFLDAPVSGGPRGAQTGKLAIWVGGDEAVFARHRAVLEAIGDQVIYVGPIGAGCVTKLVHNCAGYTIQAALAEVFTLGVKAGVDPLALWQSVRQGAVGRKRTFDRLVDQFLSGTYDPPNFALRLAHKDMTLATELGRELHVPMRAATLALEELTEALNRGWGARDSRIAMVLQQERSGIEIKVDPERLKAVDLNQ